MKKVLILIAITILFSGCKPEEYNRIKQIAKDAEILKILATGSSAISGYGTGGPSPLTCDSQVQVWNNTNELGADGTEFIAPPDFGNPPWHSGGGNNMP